MIEKIEYLMKKSIIYFLIIVICLIIPSKTYAGGSLFSYDGLNYKLQKQNTQVGFISFENGIQKILINVNFIHNTTSVNKGFWIFPLPCTPQNAQIDIIKGLPTIESWPIQHILLNKILNFMETSVYQGYLPALVINTGSNYFLKTFETKGMAETHKSIIKYGVTSELVSFDNVNQCKNYFAKKTIAIDEKLQKLIDEYISKNNLFVVSYISDSNEFNKIHDKIRYNNIIENEIQVYISFKTDRIFYPLRLTSLYNDLVIPMTIYIYGYKTAELYSNIASDTKINYLSGFLINDDEFKNFFPKNATNYAWTKIEIETKSKNLINDLYISDEISHEAKFIVDYYAWIYLPITAMYYIILSYILLLILFKIFCKNNIPGHKTIFLLSISCFISHLLALFMAFYMKIGKMICLEQNDVLYTGLKVDLKTQRKLFYLISLIFISYNIYFVRFETFILRDPFSMLFPYVVGVAVILLIFWLLNKCVNMITINFCILYFMTFTFFYFLYSYHSFNYLKHFFGIK